MAIRILTVGLALGFQAEWVTRSYVVPSLWQIWELRGSPAWYRAAVFEGGGEFAGYVSFLREQVPEDGRIILPPLQSNPPFDHVGFMQYFLFPRDLHNCGADEVAICTARASGPQTYILALPGFPDRALAGRTKRLIVYQDGLGIYAPK